jgi:hypothetical protein
MNNARNQETESLFTPSVQGDSSMSDSRWNLCCSQYYSGRRTTPSLGYVTVRGEGKVERARGARRQRVCLSMYSVTENILSLIISTQSVAF